MGEAFLPGPGDLLPAEAYDEHAIKVLAFVNPYRCSPRYRPET